MSSGNNITKEIAGYEHEQSWFIGKDPDAGKDWRQEEKGMIEDEMVGWHHQLNGHELQQAQGVGDGQGSLACCSPWGHQELDTTERLNWVGLVMTAIMRRVGGNQSTVLQNYFADLIHFVSK